MSTNAIVFDIQKFSIHDGPGIRTVVFLKGCPLTCKWCANPESNNSQPELMYFPDKCISCKKCLEKCMNGAIENINENIVFNPIYCKGCLECAAVCSSGARKVSGKSMSVDEVLVEVEKDMVFYKTSGGGVTFSGGEPLLWPYFVKELGAEIKKQNVNTTIETCGYFPEENFNIIKDIMDLVLFDIKFINEKKHIEYCGESNKQVLSNFKAVVQNIPVIVRIPIIPGINDTSEDLNDIIEFLSPYKNVLKEINILPYHNLGTRKYDALCRPYLLEDVKIPSKEHMKKIKVLFENKGYVVKIGG